MNVQEISEIRELTANELDEITGGLTATEVGNGVVIGWLTAVGTLAIGVIGSWLADLFD